ncbi:MAG: hypothetical protein R3A52_02460 [Polyangiales bacterium]
MAAQQLERVGVERVEGRDGPEPRRAQVRRDVVEARAERGHLDDLHAQPPPEVLAEGPAEGVFAEVAVGRAHDPHVGVAGLAVAAHALELPVAVEEAQQERLHLGGELPHLVEEERAPVGALHRAEAPLHAAGVGADLGAEEVGARELALEERAVHRDEGPAAPAVSVEGPREPLLARARRPEEHDAGDPPLRAVDHRAVRASDRVRGEDHPVGARLLLGDEGLVLPRDPRADALDARQRLGVDGLPRLDHQVRPRGHRNPHHLRRRAAGDPHVDRHAALAQPARDGARDRGGVLAGVIVDGVFGLRRAATAP